jgi:serine/threonine protein kinase
MHYMSPEQVKGSSELDRRSDIYSLGVVLYEAVTGRKPFDAKSDFEVFMAHVNQEPPPPSSVRAGIPPEVDQIIRTAMAKQPSDRVQTAEEFRGSLGKLQGVLSDPSVASSAPKNLNGEPQRETAAPSVNPAPSSAVPADADAFPAAPLAKPDAYREAPPDPMRESEEWQTEISSSRQTPAFQPRFDRSETAPRTEPAIPSSERAGNDLFSRGVAPESAGERRRADSEAWRAETRGEFGRPAPSAPAQSFDDTWPDEEAAEGPKDVPLLLRSTDELPGAQGHPDASSPQRRRQPASAPPGDQTFAGWTTKDVLAVGALTFVIVAAVFFAMLTFLNR